MKNSKVLKVWMLIIKKRKSYKQVYTFCMNKYKQNEKELQNTLMLFNAPFYILVFEHWRTINQKLVIHNSICFDLIFYTELQSKI
jgi:hypothetical protein